ncbi:MAG: hypothetical protein RAP41_03895 [Candidatus Orphnella occulta]|nr:hypothetical protein [Candidatus Orphnella occulta]
MQRIFRWFILSVMCLLILVFISVLVYAIQVQNVTQEPEQDTDDRLLTIHLQGVSSATASLKPFGGAKAISPIAKTQDAKNGKTAVIKIPAQYLPREFLLKIDYRDKETDFLSHTGRYIFINKQDIELSVNPLYINNSDYTKFSDGETENTVYRAFMEESSKKRMPIESLRQFLLSYTLPESKLYTQAAEEFEQRRLEYNTWLSNQAEAYGGLFVSNLFQFQYIPQIEWSGSLEERYNRLLNAYFDGIDFSNPLITYSHNMSLFMDGYIRLYSMKAATEELRNSSLIKAGRIACEKASHGHPEVYGWMVDYFYKGYAMYKVDDGIVMLREHIDNPNCLTSKREQITKYLESKAILIPGALSPDFVIADKEGNNFEFHKWKGIARHKLLLFTLTGCAGCKTLKKALTKWYDEPKNKERLDIIAIDLRETETEAERAKTIAALPSEWKYIYAKGGMDSPVAMDYAITGAPAMFLIETEGNTIVSLPNTFIDLIDVLNKDIAVE